MEESHARVRDFLGGRPDLPAIDATCGNGGDTLELARARCRVFAFDVQKAAVSAAKALLERNSLADRAVFFECGHEEMESALPREVSGRIRVAMFNLGWLPKSDKSVVTRPESTLKALESLETLMAPGDNLVSVLSYRGHAGGMDEFRAVKAHVGRFNPRVFGDESNAASPVLFVFSV